MIIAAPLQDCWLIDTNFKLSAANARTLANSQWTSGGQLPSFIRGVWRYVSLGAPSSADITTEESGGILNAGLALLLVQHAHLPGWVATGAQGKADGDAAVGHAQSVAYQPGCSLAFDLEGCQTIGQHVIDHCTEWATAIRNAGWSPVLYVGYATGLTPAALGTLPFDCFWSDFGPRSVVPQGFACKQHSQTAIANIPIDPDWCSADLMGKTLMGMVDAVTDPNLEPTDPAAGGGSLPAA